jgi:hypothetical protein
MFITKRSLHRRTFLRGMGATVALPLLDAMVPAFTASAQTPAAPVRRFAGLYLPHGMIMPKFTPAASGSGFEFPLILKSLEPYRESLVIVTGANGPLNLDNGGHAYAPSSWLTGATAKKTQGSDIYLGASIDQVIAKQIGHETVFPSLEFATEDFTSYVGACETGFSCTYMNTISWESPTTPLPMEINPRVVFERLFGAPGTPEQRSARIRRNRSILDAVTEKATELQRGLVAEDRSRLSAYLDNIREIERRIQKAEQQSARDVAVLAPTGIPARRVDHAALLFDLLAVAWQADLTRVASFMMGRDVTYQSYPEIGVTEGHHPLSHHGNNPEKMERFAAINTYETQFFARFLERLRSTPDGDGSLLDHSIILFGSGMSGGNSHDTNGLPIVVAGGGAGRIRGDRHLHHPVGPPPIGFPLGNVLLTLGQKMGVEIEQHGQSTGTIDL